MNNKISFKKIFIKNYISVWITFLCLTFHFGVSAQETQIGIEYYKAKEYQKAKTVFEKLAKDKDKLDEIHEYYLETLITLNLLDEADKFLKKQIKHSKGKPIYYVDLGLVLEKQNKTNESTANYEKAISQVLNNEKDAVMLSEHFNEIGKSDYAINTLLAVRKFQNNPLLFSNSLARLYKTTGKTAEMIYEYLIYSESEANLDYFKAIIQDDIKTEKDNIILEKVLYENVQKFPDSPFYTEALISYLVNQKQFFKAYLQARALDKRLKLEGQNVYELALLTRQNKDYVNAAKMFEYLVKEYPNSQEYPVVRRFLISCKEEAIKNVYPVDEKDIKELIVQYDKLLEEVGINQRTVEAMKSKANLYAFYLNDKDKAIEILNKAIKAGAVDPNFVSRCKLDLGDIEVLNNDFWEATLTYQQVEKAEKDNPIGYEAKLRNAKLNYYKGDFELAEDILNILKKATTREIANDAMALSLLIKDNTGEDSTEVAMKCYASAELLIFQNRLNVAIDSLSKIILKYNKSSLVDDALYQRANCYFKMGETDNAVKDLNIIVEQFSFDVLGDDAMFLLAITEEEKLKNKEKAMLYYQDILKKYPGSIYVAEARNRFRALRGDVIN